MRKKDTEKKKKLYKFTYDLAINVIPNGKMRNNLRRSNGCLEQQQCSSSSRNKKKKRTDNEIDNYWLYIAIAIKFKYMSFLNSRP